MGYAEDRIALQDVMGSYACGVDERDMDLYRSCFADDVVVVGFGEETIHGGDAWRDYVENALQRFGPTQHLMAPQLATIDGDTATCRTDVQAFHCLKEPEGGTLILWATYLDEMARIDGRWCITRHELVSRHTRVETP